MILGITGSIATGKSTVSRFFADLGAHLIDWDLLGHEVMQPGQAAWKGIVDFFGKDVLNQDSTIDREVLGRLVFNKPDKLSRLNEIVHPEIMKVDKRLVDEIRGETPGALIVKEIALMSERGKRLLVDKAVVVCSNEENQIKRLAERGIGEEEARVRIRAQRPMKEKLQLADFIIYNDGTKEQTKKQVEIIYNQVHSMNAHG